MSTTVKTGWLNDKNGDKFAPKTLTSQVQTSDGTLIEDKIKAEIDAAKADILSNVSIDVDDVLSSTSENPVQNKVINTELEAIKEDVDSLESAVGGKLDTSTASSTYETKTDAGTKLAEAKSYTDTAVSGLASTSSVNTSISTHNTSTTAHEDIRELITSLSTAVDNFLDVDDTTKDQLSEVLALIENNKGTLESLTTNKINVSDIVNNLTTNSTSKVLSAAQGVAIKNLIDALQTAVDGKADDEHTHAISEVTNLQSTLDAKAAQTSLDSHTSDTTKHITATERTNWNAAKTHADSAHVTGVKGSSESTYRTGNVNITPANIGLGNVNNTSDANKPVSTAQQTAIDGALSTAKSYTDTSLTGYYTKDEIDNLELITVADVDAICSATIQVASASEVTF